MRKWRQCWMVGLMLSASSACGQGGDLISKSTGAEYFMALSAQTATLHLGEHVLVTSTLQRRDGTDLSKEPVVWSSGDTALAVVDRTGLVTAVGSGTVNIFATSTVGVRGALLITVVREPVASMTITPPVATLPVGTTLQLRATLRDAAGHALPSRAVTTWISSNPALATVDGIGVVTGIGAGGPVVITAALEGQVTSAQVTVVP